MTDRPKSGPADPETRRRLLREALDQPTKGTGVAARAPAPAKKKKPASTLDLLDPNKPRQRRVGQKGQTMEEAVTEAVRGAKPD